MTSLTISAQQRYGDDVFFAKKEIFQRITFSSLTALYGSLFGHVIVVTVMIICHFL